MIILPIVYGNICNNDIIVNRVLSSIHKNGNDYVTHNELLTLDSFAEFENCILPLKYAENTNFNKNKVTDVLSKSLNFQMNDDMSNNNCDINKNGVIDCWEYSWDMKCNDVPQETIPPRFISIQNPDPNENTDTTPNRAEDSSPPSSPPNKSSTLEWWNILIIVLVCILLLLVLLSIFVFYVFYKPNSRIAKFMKNILHPEQMSTVSIPNTSRVHANIQTNTNASRARSNSTATLIQEPARNKWLSTGIMSSNIQQPQLSSQLQFRPTNRPSSNYTQPVPNTQQNRKPTPKSRAGIAQRI